jgi:hypothetical protein
MKTIQEREAEENPVWDESMSKRLENAWSAGIVRKKVDLLLEILKANNGEIYKRELIRNYDKQGISRRFINWLVSNHGSLVRERKGIITTKGFNDALTLPPRNNFI